METRKDLNTLAADVIKKGEALYAKLSTEQIDLINEIVSPVTVKKVAGLLLL